MPPVLARKSPRTASPPADLAGIVVASLTPVRDDFSIDVPRLSAHMTQLFAAGCSFVSPFGTTGEGPSFSTAEKVAALRQLADLGTPMDRLILGVMTPTMDDAAHLIQAAADLGCRAALVLPPFYYGAVPQIGIAHFIDSVVKRLGGALPIDILLYNIPSLSRNPYTPELIGDLIARYGSRIAGIKDSTGSRDNAVMLATTFPQIAVFTGDDRVLPHLLAAGGAGLIGGMPNIVAADLCRAYRDRDRPEGAALFDKAAERIMIVEAYGSPTVVKALVAHAYGDREWARMAPPLAELDAEKSAAAVRAFEETGFVFGSSAE